MTTVERLLETSKDVWSQYHTHPFVCGIRDGNLEKRKFRNYILQDYRYLYDYTKIFAIGVAKAKSRETTQLFSRYIQGLTQGEMGIHRGYIQEFAITPDEVNGTKAALPNLSYTSYMLRVAYEESEVEILAAILSCAHSYEVIATEMVRHSPNCHQHPFYGYWIQGYTDPDYARRNRDLFDYLNALTVDYTPEQIAHLEDIFLACSRYELGFWDMAWAEESGL